MDPIESRRPRWHAALAWLPLAATLLATALPQGQAGAAELQLKMASVQTAEHPFSRAALKFAELMAAKSGQRIKARLFANGTLGGDAQVISSVQGGTVDITIVSTGLLSTMDKDFSVFYQPLAFDTAQQADAVVDGPFGRRLLDKLPSKGLVGLAFWEHGFRSVTNNKRPLARWEDFQGLKLRVIQIPVFLDIYNALGANAVPMPFPELYAALESRAIDGQETALPTMETARFAEVQKYLSLTQIVYDPLVVLISRKTWDRLDEADRRIVSEAAREATTYERQLNREREAAMVKASPGKGMAVNLLSPAERERMRQKLQPVIDAHARQVSPEVLADFHAALRLARQAPAAPR